MASSQFPASVSPCSEVSQCPQWVVRGDAGLAPLMGPSLSSVLGLGGCSVVIPMEQNIPDPSKGQWGPGGGFPSPLLAAPQQHPQHPPAGEGQHPGAQR